ncbi:DUF1285 domain-containing protein [Acinetobacter bereziniae]|jgi:hypothetical protein|uniref:DUF1285 domain-containing protein n=1 Tax=Acinetobacter bereziniae LMG 1003 = CIP 70.12 TaxID=981324 RepID=N9EF06_ACIBZ|nr:DUF1285 domain-containing protein [Acinetobacter bereziniae]ATZ62194.1 hypothetical protein BSR55_01960 [Acinetobacter bereziniae]ENV91273.1 hypothetical protein F938_03777 [Acinetobacter bereziniae LMG 1003 = CIP 70.12]MBJ8552945.1 DUF1285 domain-containing protein [Acinetobacter bereziniae]MBJ9909356.1 DUF1285 domain-containing protein [Acinetobacter bereziniae]MBJ9931005.1 DUF1285 domain-containing protein [Acinetobacter bereziniae]
MVNQNNSTSAAQNQPDSDNKNLMSITQYLKGVQAGHKRSIPPLEQWQPKHCGKMDLKVKANGEWWHEGQLIKRQALLDLFTKVLWKEQGKFYLKTPVEQIEIEVEDEPLLVNQVDQVEIDGQTYLQVTTTNQDICLVDKEHAIFMREYQGELRPYVHIRFGINALIQRNAFFHLIEYGSLLENEQGDTILSLQSGDLHLQLGT